MPQSYIVGEDFTVNGKTVKVPDQNYNCKTKNLIYIAQCCLCDGEMERDYVGQTQQSLAGRISGHRSCFKIDDEDKIDKSALAMHARDKHPDDFNINNFKFMVLKSVNGKALDRQESRAIEGMRTNVMGLNRMKIQK